MLVAQAQHQGSVSFISGVDRVFLAPELQSYKMGPQSDVWSIGTMLYILITGGVTDKRHEEFFDFKESIWFNVSEELKEFMLMALQVDPQNRGSIDQLLKTDFINMARQHALDRTPLEETTLTEQGGNLYKFYMAHCINEIICRYRLNQEKRRKVFSLKE